VDEHLADTLVESLHRSLLEHGGAAYSGSEDAPTDDIEDMSLFGPKWVDLVSAGRTSPSVPKLVPAGIGPEPINLSRSSGEAPPGALEDEVSSGTDGVGNCHSLPSATQPSPKRSPPPRPPGLDPSELNPLADASASRDGKSTDEEGPKCPALLQCEDPWWHNEEQAARIAQSIAATERVEQAAGSGAAFVYDLGTVRRRAQRLLDELTVASSGGGLFYAVKANDSMEVLRVMVGLGIGMECVSEQEVQLALRAGREAGRLLPAPAGGLAEPLRPASLLGRGGMRSASDAGPG